MNNVIFLTTTRADFGLLKPLIKALKIESEFCAKVIASGTHFSKEYGNTSFEIEVAGIEIDYRVHMNCNNTSSSDLARAFSELLISLTTIFEREKPDLLILLGDRFETVSAAMAANLCGVKIAHLHGGEITLGAMDDAFRHAITKMSSIHFTSTEEHRRRVIQMGEQPTTVFNVGAIGVENAKKIQPISKDDLQKRLGLELGESVILMTYHPETIDLDASGKRIEFLLEALIELRDIAKLRDMQVIFTKSNADIHSEVINQKIDAFIESHPQIGKSFASLGQELYFGLLPYVKVVLGNSSSGLIEVPSFKVPVINVGNRQLGRMSGPSVFHTDYHKASLMKLLMQVFDPQFRLSIDYENPYEQQDSCLQIVGNIKSFLNDKPNRFKPFFDVDFIEKY